MLRFGTDFKATTKPVYLSRAKNTLPNFPYPRRRIILKLFLLSPFFSDNNLNLSVDLFWLRKKDGRAF
jgi:hypothetical protein